MQETFQGEIQAIACERKVILSPKIITAVLANFVQLRVKRSLFRKGTWTCLTGDGHGDVLADDKLFSTSSGRSTEPDFRPRLAYKSLRCVDGLDGAKLREKEILARTVAGTRCSVAYSVTGCCWREACCVRAGRLIHHGGRLTCSAGNVDLCHEAPLIRVNLN